MTMSRLFRYIAGTAMALLCCNAFAQEQEKPKDIPTIAAESADYLMEVLKLEDYQVFQVDSTFQYNYSMMSKELDDLKKSGAMSTERYQMVSDKWMNANDTTFKMIFTDQQWSRYLKCKFAHDKKARDKRMKARQR